MTSRHHKQSFIVITASEPLTSGKPGMEHLYAPISQSISATSYLAFDIALHIMFYFETAAF